MTASVSRYWRPGLLVLVWGLAACSHSTLEPEKAAAALRGHERFAQPLVIGLPLGPTAHVHPASAREAAQVLAQRGDVVVAATEPLEIRLTPQGNRRLGAGGWALGEAPVRTLSVPVARRDLVQVSDVEPKPGGGVVSFDWRWVMTDVGRELRAAGVPLQDWGLRIDDRHTFKGVAELTLSGDRWLIRIGRPPRATVD